MLNNVLELLGYPLKTMFYLVFVAAPLMILSCISGVISVYEVLFVCRERAYKHYLALSLALPSVVVGISILIWFIPFLVF